MVELNVQPGSQPSPGARVLDDPPLPAACKAAAAGGGVLASVCCGGGLLAVIATVVGAGGTVAFLRSWVEMQGVTLVSTALAIALVLGLAAYVTRRATAGMPAAETSGMYRRSLYRLAGWALVGYVAYFIVVNMVLGLVGFEYLES